MVELTIIKNTQIAVHVHIAVGETEAEMIMRFVRFYMCEGKSGQNYFVAGSTESISLERRSGCLLRGGHEDTKKF